MHSRGRGRWLLWEIQLSAVPHIWKGICGSTQQEQCCRREMAVRHVTVSAQPSCHSTGCLMFSLILKFSDMGKEWIGRLPQWSQSEREDMVLLFVLPCGWSHVPEGMQIPEGYGYLCRRNSAGLYVRQGWTGTEGVFTPPSWGYTRYLEETGGIMGTNGCLCISARFHSLQFCVFLFTSTAHAAKERTNRS